jgi:hypothetical protein
MTDLVLPAFEMDCREWLVHTPQDVGLPEELAGVPLLAMLSTVLLSDGEFREVSGVLTVGLLDDGDAPESRPVIGAQVAARLTGPDEPDDAVRFLLPVPDGRLALVAEFHLSAGTDTELDRRIESLMASFRWAA